MFNMYDDSGDRFPIHDPYQVKKLTSVAPTNNKITRDQQNDEQKKHKFKDMLGNEATNAYKKMTNIHIEEEIFHAYQLMHSDVVIVKEYDTIYDCWMIMEKNDVKQIPIVGLNGKIKGLATMKNITNAIIEHINTPKYIYNTTIETIAIKNIMTAEPIADIRRIANVMVQYHLNRIPIVDSSKDEVVGIISRADILRAVSTNPHFQLWA